MRCILLAVLIAACGGPAKPTPSPTLPTTPDAPPPKPTPQVIQENWSGTLVLVHELIDITLHFTSKDGQWSGTIDVPAAKVTGLPLAGVAFKPDGIGFTIEKPSGQNELYTFRRNGDSAEGVLVVAGQTFPAKLVRLASGEAPRPAVFRPQTPKPPFPYGSREVEIPSIEDGVLAGTLTIPEGKGPFPAILLISGSGQQDRDETIYGHKAFAIIADKLTRQGIAVLRTDDRMMGKTKGKPSSLETDFGDGKAAFEFLLKQPEVDPKRAGILGHSIGGLIAPVVATRTKGVSFIVSLAGPGIKGAELVPLQLEASLKLGKMPEPLIKAIVDGQKAVGAAIVSGKEADIKAALKKSMIDASAAAGAPKPSDDDLDKAVASKMPEVTNPWVQAYFKTDPAAFWKKFKGPVLVVIGDKDTQVPADINIAKVSEALKAAGNKKVKTEKRPGLNHLYQHAQTGVTEEYAKIEESFDKETLDLIAAWLGDVTKKK